MTGPSVRRIQARLPSLIVAGLSLYFAGVFGFTGVKALLGLTHGFADYASGAIASAVVNAFELAPQHLTTIGAALGALKVAIAGFFLLAAFEKFPTDPEEPADREALDLALHGAFALTLLLLVPSWIGDDADAVRMLSANLMLLAVTVGVSMFERGRGAREATRLANLEEADAFLASIKMPLPTGKSPLADGGTPFEFR